VVEEVALELVLRPVQVQVLEGHAPEVPPQREERNIA
jgi:hypothetical protein